MAVLALALGGLLPSAASAATFTPTTTLDSNNGACTPALCTLRDAINAANASPGNTVQIPAGIYGLSLGQLGITQSMAITGANARTTVIDAQGTSRVFRVGDAVSAAMADLTVTGGFAGPASSSPTGDGGGIASSGNLALTRVAVLRNTASLGGGGINAPFEAGVPTPNTVIQDSLIADNTVTGGLLNGQGGGAALFGDTAIRNTTITGNLVANPGANEGGGLVSARALASSDPARLALLNVTIANNRIAGLPPGGVTPNFGGGLSGDNLGPMGVFSELSAQNTIIAGNTVDGVVQDCGLVTTVTSLFNLSSDATCGFNDLGSKQNTNPLLGPLADNGGPTNTMAIANTSPAKNTGTNVACPGTDQRAVTRPQALICDMGAFELKGPNLSVVQNGSKTKKKRGKRAAIAQVKGKKVNFAVTITNRGEQTAPGAQLSVALRGKASKLNPPGDCRRPPKGKKKRKKGKKRKRPSRSMTCPLGDLGPGTSRTVRFRVGAKRKKVVSVATATSNLPNTGNGNTAVTKLRIKRTKKR